MARRNKGGSRSIRRGQHMHQQGMREDDRQRMKVMMLKTLEPLQGVDIEECHQILFSCLRSIEVEMEKQGIEIPKYIEHRVSQVRHDMNPDYTPCRRCEFATDRVEDSMGCQSRCSILKWANGEDYFVCNDDGCSRGLLRKEYRK